MTDVDVDEILRTVEDPELGTDVVSLGVVSDVTVEDDTAEVSLAHGAPHAPVVAELRSRIEGAFEEHGIDVRFSTQHDDADGVSGQPLPGVENVIAVASGKGGVGKSTVAVNLAASMSRRGARVGILDADVYGPNIPRMMNARERPAVTDDEQLVPVDRHGMSVMSMEFLTEGGGPVIWRGPMVDKVLTQLLDDVAWGDLDYLVVDLPPGTGDTQLTLLQRVPVAGAVVVTTPQAVAVDDADRGMRMFTEYDTTVLGIVENMSGFVCPDCGSEHDIFNSGGGRALAERFELPFLGSIPLTSEIRTRGDDGRPVALDDTTETSRAFHALAGAVMDNVSLVHRRTQAGE
ncbi:MULTISPECIES: Mrp/NBP35 family ATP-binding protein [Haloferax]|uniref:Iron-sulfur cluster carrier protein n=2 Tax=Haloferax TaxID=2251 RepID=A0A6G1Z043_9EURY|nr:MULTISPECIES: Mrp/NBP35 family ATP-binding protein [Haloferax]KAB1187248.1 Mrp/NBP35 family ATP-binding protein [Haloferax sp. CBA1149]MRW79892.1 P-loop NTPase [Haloferax marinisediminis]